MQSNIQERLEVFRQAGIGPAELSSLLNVSRVTASLWLNGHSRPHHFLEERITRLLQAVEDALAASELPLHSDIPRRERKGHLRKIITTRMESSTQV